MNGIVSTYNSKDKDFKELTKRYIEIKKEKNLFLLLNPLSLMFFIISSALAMAIADRILKINNQRKYIQALAILGLIGCLIDFYVNFRTYIIQPRENKLLIELKLFDEELDKWLKTPSKLALDHEEELKALNLTKAKEKIKAMSDHILGQLENNAEDTLGKTIRYLFFAYSGIFLALQIIDTLEVFRPFEISNKVIMTSVSLGATAMGLIGASLGIFRYYTQEKEDSRRTNSGSEEKKVDFSVAVLILSCVAAVISIAAKILSYYDYIENLEIPVVEIMMIVSYSIGMFVCGYQLRKSLNEPLHSISVNCEIEALEVSIPAKEKTI